MADIINFTATDANTLDGLGYLRQVLREIIRQIYRQDSSLSVYLSASEVSNLQTRGFTVSPMIGYGPHGSRNMNLIQW